jgi:Protein of unknown function (DUF3563)
MRTNIQPFYDNSLAGALARLMRGLLQYADHRAQRPAPHVRIHDNTPGTRGSWLDRLDTWFWKRELKEREAFLAQSLDICDLEHRMRSLDLGEKRLGMNRFETIR